MGAPPKVDNFQSKKVSINKINLFQGQQAAPRQPTPGLHEFYIHSLLPLFLLVSTSLPRAIMVLPFIKVCIVTICLREMYRYIGILNFTQVEFDLMLLGVMNKNCPA